MGSSGLLMGVPQGCQEGGQLVGACCAERGEEGLVGILDRAVRVGDEVLASCGGREEDCPAVLWVGLSFQKSLFLECADHL